MKHWSCDCCGEKLVPSEVTTLKLVGPLRDAACRAELHSCKLCMYDVAERFNITLAPPPEHLAADLAERRKAEATPKSRASKGRPAPPAA